MVGAGDDVRRRLAAQRQTTAIRSSPGHNRQSTSFGSDADSGKAAGFPQVCRAHQPDGAFPDEVGATLDEMLRAFLRQH